VCPGNPVVCSGHGVCFSGLCLCNGSYTGSLCNQVAIITTVAVGDIQPSVNITPITTQNNTSNSTSNNNNNAFGVLMDEIIEMSENGDVVQKLLTSSLNFSVVKYEAHSYTQWVYFALLLFGNQKLSRTVASVSQLDQPTVTISIYNFNESSVMNFANQSLPFPENSLKIYVSVTYWPFASVTNTLRTSFKITSAAQPPPQQCGNNNNNNNNNDNDIKSVQINGNGYGLYIALFADAIIDGRVKKVEFTTTNNDLFVDIPYFWTNATIDPSFAVLLNTDSSASSQSCAGNTTEGGLTWIDTVIIVVVVVVVAVACGVGIFMYRRYFSKNRQSLIKLKSVTTFS